MEQKDYLLREIEKIGIIIRAMLQKFFEKQDNLAIRPEKQLEDAKGMLFKDLSFDLDKFILLDNEASTIYLSSFEGFNVENIEHLAVFIAQIGFNGETGNSETYLEKALYLYELCNVKSKSYSVKRAANIQDIQNAL